MTFTCREAVDLVRTSSIPQNAQELLSKIRKLSVHGGTSLTIKKLPKDKIKEFINVLNAKNFMVSSFGNELSIYWDID